MTKRPAIPCPSAFAIGDIDSEAEIERAEERRSLVMSSSAASIDLPAPVP
eukprot:CAMPEP_0205910700 /NCGR_PEP_ID=MMETSP1325-20131115/4625_1 /ASSEMBLY_ACC=CAM_ASM_000708 /TAXON_ID=236786 /ORGANISM="Florenciella sp., Strain RCC1007" /LENGTH=49 /DNA_ID= /DNA_START= /DNA_END= /DNA_ORIENTATION=